MSKLAKKKKQSTSTQTVTNNERLYRCIKTVKRLYYVKSNTGVKLVRVTNKELKTLMSNMVKPAVAQAKDLGRRKDAIRDTFAVQAPYVERSVSDEPLAKEGSAGHDKTCSIHVLHRTNRLADAEGRSCKACIDGIVEAGILKDDSPKFVTEVSQSQETTKGEEETVITLEWR